MVIMILSKITKKAWFEQPLIHNTVLELLGMGTLSPSHLQLCLEAVYDLIVEIGYLPKLAHLAFNRRVSQKFRDGADSALSKIFRFVS